jgi:hypothetical protein
MRSFSLPALRWTHLAALAVLVMAPILILGERTQDSWQLDIVWARQFADQLATNPYPRWLERSFDGFGAPVFYFYPPLAFYAAGAVHYLTLGLISTFQEIWVVATLALFASGLSMRAWLREIGGREWLAAAYLIAPYHLFDIHVRGALAEFCAYALVPLVMLALKRALDAKSPLPLAAAYAALVMTHLPTALLVSALLMAPYILWKRGDLVRTGAGMALGLALAAIYLVPALTLPLNTAQMYRQNFRVADLYVWNWTWPIARVIAPQLLMMTFLAILARGRSVWSLWSYVLCAVVLGLIPVLMLPILDKVQFPWRALMLIEFCVATKLALDPRALSRPVGLIYPVMLLGLMIQPPVKAPLGRFPDATEYLPAAVVGPATEPVDLPPPAYLAMAERTHAGATVTLRRFNFPSWTSCRPIEGVLVTIPEGCEARIAITGPEKLGAGISLAALLAWLGLALSRLRISLPRRTWTAASPS